MTKSVNDYSLSIQDYIDKDLRSCKIELSRYNDRSPVAEEVAMRRVDMDPTHELNGIRYRA